MRGVRSLSGLAGPNASLKDAGGGGAEYGSVQFVAVGATSWTVPDGVTTIYAVCVGGGATYSAGGGQSSIKRGATVLCSANPGQPNSGGGAGGTGGVKDGGGNGGAGSSSYAGGAGGYSGNGGTNTGDGTGGAGGSGDTGGGVGIWGEGPSGLGSTGHGGGGSGGSDGYSSTDDQGGAFGGGSKARGGGGELSWVNDVSVTPGETLTITVGAAGVYGPDRAIASQGAVAIYWGNCGSFPDLANVPKPF